MTARKPYSAPQIERSESIAQPNEPRRYAVEVTSDLGLRWFLDVRAYSASDASVQAELIARGRMPLGGRVRTIQIEPLAEDVHLCTRCGERLSSVFALFEEHRKRCRG
jgi:hypothetical protein